MLNRLHKAGVQPGKAFDASDGKKAGLDDLLYAEHAIERNRRVAPSMETKKALSIIQAFNALPGRQRSEGCAAFAGVRGEGKVSSLVFIGSDEHHQE